MNRNCCLFIKILQKKKKGKNISSLIVDESSLFYKRFVLINAIWHY